MLKQVYILLIVVQQELRRIVKAVWALHIGIVVRVRGVVVLVGLYEIIQTVVWFLLILIVVA
jgi:hypothetical protein